MYKINRKRLINIFTDLVKIPSPSWHEQGVIDYIEKYFKKIGVKTKRFKCKTSFNLFVKIPGKSKKPAILFSAHTDTVVPCENVNPIITEKRISSDGTTILGSDDKSALAMFMEAACVLKENSIEHGEIEMLLSCAEEVGLHGIKNFDLSKLKSRMVFVFDSGGSVGQIVIKAPYHSTMEIKISGKAAHAGMAPEKGINAIKVMSEIIAALPNGRLDPETTINVGQVSGGKATNIVPEEALFKLEIRSIDKKKMADLEKQVKEITARITRGHRARHKITRNLEYNGYSIKENQTISQITASALKRIGIKHRFEVSGGGSDTNIFNGAGIKAINLSCGMQNVHTKNEYILKKDLVKGTELVLSIIESV
jgi:tripeptide aminopeptidase